MFRTSELWHLVVSQLVCCPPTSLFPRDTQPGFFTRRWRQNLSPKPDYTGPQYQQQAMYIHRNNEALSRNHCCRGKAKRITNSTCASALVNQHTKRMRRTILAHFSTLSHKRNDFREEVMGYETCILSFCTFVWNISRFKKSARYNKKCT